MEHRPPLLSLIAVAALLSGCGPEPAPVYQGYVEGEYLHLSASQSGKLVELPVARGQSVAADAPLFVVEAEDQRQRLAQAQQQREAARAQLADMQSGKRLPEVAVVQAQLAQAVANARKAALQWQRDEAQYRGGGISKGQLDDSRENAAATAAHESELRHQIEVAQLPQRSAQIAAQKAQVEAAEASLRQAQWQLGQTHVNAPTAGQVTDTLYRVGEWVPAGSPVVQMLPPANVKVRFFVPQAAVGALKLGQQTRVQCDGCGNAIAAQLTYIAPSAEYTPPVIFSNESRAKLVYMVEARTADADAVRLHPGQPVQVSLP